MIKIGRICIKTAGRDSNKKCVIIDILDGNYVLIDGETRRRKCNTAHLEPLDKVIKIEKNADHETVESEFKKMGIDLPKKTKEEVKEKKEKPKKPHKKRKVSAEPKRSEKKKKKTDDKEEQ